MIRKISKNVSSFSTIKDEKVVMFATVQEIPTTGIDFLIFWISDSLITKIFNSQIQVWFVKLYKIIFIKSPCKSTFFAELCNFVAYRR